MSAGDDSTGVSSLGPAVLPARLSRSGTGTRRFTLRHIFLGTAFLLLVLAVVVPNSLPVPTAALMGLAFLLTLPGLRVDPGFRTLMTLYFCTVIVTIIYIIVGCLHGASLVAAAQVAAIYIVSPFLWMLIADGLLKRIGADRLIDWFVLLSLLCAVSVALFFYLYRTRGAAAVSFFFQGANVNLAQGFSGATMHVYGSLIFLCGGFFSSPELIKNRALRFSLLAMLLVCALTSGRSALIIAVPIGWVLGLMLSSRTPGQRKSAVTRAIRYGLPMLVAVVVVLALLEGYMQISLSAVLDTVAAKLASGGGSARVLMARSLFSGILDSGGIGAGHGVGVSFVSDPIHPWRYELVWLATLYRAGVLGGFIYALPFLLYMVKVIRLALARRLSPEHKFLFCGFVCAFLATNTNPYIEAFTFQWMYVIPMVALFVDYPTEREPEPEQEPE